MSSVSWLYKLARMLRDITVLVSGRPDKIAKRLVNKAIGRSIVRRLWWR
jgi:hypothetical protein